MHKYYVSGTGAVGAVFYVENFPVGADSNERPSSHQD